jgi:hypothetical protein
MVVLCLQCNRAMDVRILVTSGTTSPARTVVRDTGKEVLDLTLFSERGPGLAFSFAGTGCGQKCMEGGNLAVMPEGIDPALLRQFPFLRIRTPTREICRFFHLLYSLNVYLRVSE